MSNTTTSNLNAMPATTTEAELGRLQKLFQNSFDKFLHNESLDELLTASSHLAAIAIIDIERSRSIARACDYYERTHKCRVRSMLREGIDGGIRERATCWVHFRPIYYYKHFPVFLCCFRSPKIFGDFLPFLRDFNILSANITKVSTPYWSDVKHVTRVKWWEGSSDLWQFFFISRTHFEWIFSSRQLGIRRVCVGNKVVLAGHTLNCDQ